MSPLQAWLLAARPRTLPAAAAPVCISIGLAVSAEFQHFHAALLCLLFALSVQILANFANDYWDFIRGADTAERIGPARAVASGWISPDAMRRAIYVTAISAFAIGLGILMIGEWWYLLIGLLCIICAVAYTGGPYPLAYLGLGDIFVMIFFGWVATIFSFHAQTGAFHYPGFRGLVFCCATVIGGLSIILLAINNYRDVETDRIALKRTLAVRFGRRFVLWECRFFLVLAALFPIVLALWLQSFWPLMVGVLWPWIFQIYRDMPKADSPEQFQQLLAGAGKLLGVYGILLGSLLSLI